MGALINVVLHQSERVIAVTIHLYVNAFQVPSSYDLILPPQQWRDTLYP